MSAFTDKRDADWAARVQEATDSRATLLTLIESSFPHWIVAEDEVRALVKALISWSERLEHGCELLEKSLRSFAGPWFEDAS